MFTSVKTDTLEQPGVRDAWAFYWSRKKTYSWVGSVPSCATTTVFWDGQYPTKSEQGFISGAVA